MPASITLKEWREAKGITQVELADLLTNHIKRTITQQHISKWENGFEPRIRMRLAIFQVTGGRVKPESFVRQG